MYCDIRWYWQAWCKRRVWSQWIWEHFNCLHSSFFYHFFSKLSWIFSFSLVLAVVMIAYLFIENKCSLWFFLKHAVWRPASLISLFLPAKKPSLALEMTFLQYNNNMSAMINHEQMNQLKDTCFSEITL